MADELIFVSKRRDGLGERLRALVNAMLMSELLTAKFRFTWPSSQWTLKFQDTVKPENIFSDEFIKKFLCSESDIKKARPVQYFFSESASSGTYFCDQTLPLGQIQGLSDYSDYRRLWRSAFRKVEFSRELSRIMEDAENLDVGPLDHCIHLRAGDLIYGQNKSRATYNAKAIPFPIAEELIKRKTANEANVLICGQDLSLIEYLKCKYNTISADQFSSRYSLSYERAFFDICLMSRCSSLIAGTSGFAIVASLIGEGKRIHLDNEIDKQEQLAILSRDLAQDKIDSNISDEQIVYALKYLLILGIEKIDDRSYNSFLSLARKLAPENELFDFMAAWFYCKIGEFKAAEICARSLLSDSDKVNRFIRNFDTQFQRKKMTEIFDFKVFEKAGLEQTEKIYSLISSNI